MTNYINNLLSKSFKEISSSLLIYKGDDTKWNENIVISSPSLSYILYMLQLGASGETYETLREFTGIDSDVSSSSKKLLNIDNKLCFNKELGDKDNDSSYSSIGSKVEINSAFFIKYDINEEYSKLVGKHFKLYIKTLDFNKPLLCTPIIDDWISNSSHGLLKDMLKNLNLITKETLLVIVNVVYFEGKWHFPFDISKTKKDKFFTCSSTYIEAYYMHQTNYFRYYHDKNSNVSSIELPYMGNRYSAVVILPPKNSSYSTYLENNYVLTVVENLMKSNVEYVDVMIPKFTVKDRIDLKQYLIDRKFDSGRSASILFDPNLCNFQKITKIPIYVSAVIQSATIIVNEQKTVASAATWAVCNRLCILSPNYTFYATSPFFFFIWDRIENHPVFSSYIYNPQTE